MVRPFIEVVRSCGREEEPSIMTMPNDTFTQPPGSVGPGSPSGLDAEGATGGTRDQLRDVKNQVVDSARQSFRQARDSAGSSLDQSRQQAADRISGIANAVRGTSERLRSDQQNQIADLTEGLANHVERLSGYLRDRDLSDVRRDVEGFARRQPAVAIGVALALGLIGARFIKSGQQSGRRGGDPVRGGGYDRY
jgi:hypothetical protein